MDWYEDKPAAKRQVLSPEERLANPMKEMDLGITQDQALEETTRCFSCGLCFGCENCWMYCQSNVFGKEPKVSPGHFFIIKNMGNCDGCKKCWEECPCGFIVGE